MNKCRKIFSHVLSAVIVLALLLGAPQAVSSQTETTIVFPAYYAVFTCQSTPIAVRVEDVADLTAYHLEIDFQPGDVIVTSVENGGFLPAGLPEPTNAVNNTAGTIIWGMARQGPDVQPVSGSGVLINIWVMAVNPGATVNFTIRPYVPGDEPTNGSGSVLVHWPDAKPIDFTPLNGVVVTQTCPSTEIQLSNDRIDENLKVPSEVGTFTTIDPDPEETFEYSLVDTVNFPDNIYFTIGGYEGNVLLTNAVFNFEVDNSYTIRVRSTSSGGDYRDKTFIITITDVNDPPVLAGIGDQSVNELAALSFTASASDEDTPSSPDTLTFSLADGTSGDVPDGASIDPTTGAFSWTPTEAQGPGAYTFDVCVSDSVASDCETITVTVNEVNSAPAGSNKTVSTLEDTPYAFSAADFGFSDPSDIPQNSFLAVMITTLPTFGSLLLDSADVEAGDVVPVADILAGKLVLQPDANEFGTPYASFTFQVQDNGGTANGGADLDPEANTITIIVTPVNDAPVGVADHYYVSKSMLDISKSLYRLSVPAPGVLANDSDVDGDPLTAELKTDAAKGDLTLNEDGSFTYEYTTSELNETADSFVYTVSDEQGGTADVTVTLSIDLVDPDVSITWLEPVQAEGATYVAGDEDLTLKVHLSDLSDVAKIEFRWWNTAVTPYFWVIIDEQLPNTGQLDYSTTLDTSTLPNLKDIQVYAYAYDAAGNFVRTRFFIDHRLQVFLPLISR